MNESVLSTNCIMFRTGSVMAICSCGVKLRPIERYFSFYFSERGRPSVEATECRSNFMQITFKPLVGAVLIMQIGVSLLTHWVVAAARIFAKHAIVL